MMNQQDIFKKVGAILTELNDQYQFLSQNPGKLNDLEMELFLANANFLKDHVEIIRKLNTKSVEPVLATNLVSSEQISEAEQEAELELENIYKDNELDERVDLEKGQQSKIDTNDKEESIEELNHNFFKLDKSDNTFEFDLGQHNHSLDDKFDYEAKPIEQIFDRALSADEERILEEKKRLIEKIIEPAIDPVIINEVEEEDEVGPEPFLMPHEVEVEPVKIQAVTETVQEVKKTETISEPIIEKVIEGKPVFIPTAIPVNEVKNNVEAELKPTLNDLLASSNSSAQNPILNPISDLKQGINLNEKLLFIKDLFNGYNLAYSEAIDLVNKMNSFEMADTFLKKNYALKNDWATKQDTVDRFYEILNRRFLKD